MILIVTFRIDVCETWQYDLAKGKLL